MSRLDRGQRRYGCIILAASLFSFTFVTAKSYAAGDAFACGPLLNRTAIPMADTTRRINEARQLLYAFDTQLGESGWRKDTNLRVSIYQVIRGLTELVDCRYRWEPLE